METQQDNTALPRIRTVVATLQSHFLDPPCYQNYYLEQLKVIEWALKQTDLPINRTSGVAIAGHSMGGGSNAESILAAATHCCHSSCLSARSPPTPSLPLRARSMLTSRLSLL